MKLKWIIKISVGIGISGAAIALATRRLHFANIWPVLRHSNPGFVAAAVALLLTAFVLRALRWYLILRKADSRPAFSCVVQALFAGFAINNLLPLRAGDLVRALAFPEKLGSGRAVLLGSLVFERVLDLLSLLAIGMVVLSSSSLPPGLRAAQVTFVSVAGAGVVGILAVLVFVEPLRKLMLRVVSALPCRESLRDKLTRTGLVLMDFVAALGPRSAAELGVLSAIIWLVEGAVYLCAALAVSSPNVALGPWLAMVLANFSMLIPSAPGYVGTFHVSASAGLIATGVDPNRAGGFAILVHAVLWIPITAIGLACFAALRSRKRRSSAEFSALKLKKLASLEV